MKDLKLEFVLLFPLLLGSLSTPVLANNTVHLIRTPVSIVKSRTFCFQQQGKAISYSIGFDFSSSASGMIFVDGTLMDSFPPTRQRSISASGMFKGGLHKITLTLDRQTTLTNAYVTAYATTFHVATLFPVLSCTGARNMTTATTQNSGSSAEISEIVKKLNDLEARVNKLELLVEGKQQSKRQVRATKAIENETLDQKLNRLQKEAAAMSNLGTALLKNADEWKKEINTLRASSK